MNKERIVYYALALAMSVVLAWIGMAVISLLHFSPVKVYDAGYVFSLLEIGEILMIIVGLGCIGLSLGVIASFSRIMGKAEAVGIGAVAVVFGVIPTVLFFGDKFLFVGLALFYLFGVMVASFLASGKVKEPGFFWAFSFGMGFAKKVFYVFAVGSFLVLLLVSPGMQDNYESTFTTSLASMVSSGSGLQPTREQLRDMIEATAPEYTVDDIIAMNYPNYDELTGEKQQEVRQQLQDYLDSPTYQQQRDQAIEAQIDITMQQFESRNLSQDIEGIMGNIPFMKAFMEYAGLIGAFIFASTALLMEALVVGPACAVACLVLVNGLGDKKAPPPPSA